MSKHLLINAVTFLLIVGVTLIFMFGRPVTIVYAELNGQPGFTQGDMMLTLFRGWQIDAITQYPNYFGALVTTMLLATAGFVYSMRQWEKSKRNNSNDGI